MKRMITLLAIAIPLSASADDQQINTFMTEFHQDPQKVMNALPPKGGDNYQTPEANVVERFRARIRDDIMARAAGTPPPLDLHDRIVEPLSNIRLHNDNPARLVDAGSNLIRNLSLLSQQAPNSKKLTTQPWSDTYWPLYSGAAAWRYADRELSASNWQSYYDFSHTIKPVNTYPAHQRDLLSPAEKYDLLVGDANYTLTKKSWDSGKGYFESQGHVEKWMGLCHGWAAAAYMLPRPKQSVSVPDANGEMLKFYPSDIKSLGTLLWAEAPFDTKFIGGRCNIKNPQKDENGRIIEPDCVDNNPGSWHLAVLNQIGITGRSMIMDATYDYQVWNQPILGYKLTYFNPQTHRSSDDPNKVKIPLTQYSKDKFAKYRSRSTQSIVGVKMVVDYMVETNPTHREKDVPTFDGVSRVTYYYDLELDKQGDIIGGEWYQNRHPDFLWTPTPNAIAKSYYDGQGSWRIDQPVPTSWQRQAPHASRYSQPMTAVVSTLFDASAGAQTPAISWQQLVTQDNHCLDVESSSNHPGANVFGWQCHDGSNQQWQLTPEGKLISKVAPDLCLDQQGVQVSMESCADTPSQTWRFEGGQIKNALDNALKWNANSWRVGADIKGSQWEWR
ncbi:ricin-type beta-trefoil lectin domain protein [Salinivibrio sp. IB872]|uniref:ricin-type beta-trefoil lectin domain protein n=1 Tax=Salinivibrio sp. IB872 TaxID=1766123 RepID=UPI000986B092|nr:ricin-type beta-trefoil lectin domain protein [Salinivibrio sp. IB872]OOF21040.1 peptidase [Salinivibrio sp. IB872]